MTIETIQSAISTCTQSLVLEFAGHWLRSHEQGFSASDALYFAMQQTNVGLSNAQHREIARRALAIVADSGVTLH